MRVTVVGKNGFLGHALAKLPDAKNWTFLTHEEALGETDWIPKTDILINCAYHPDFMKGEYSPIKDIDFMLSGYIQNSGIHYVMISSRAVYGPAPDNLYLTEDMPPAPDTAYGQNKLRTENALAEMLAKDKLTILRCSNIFGAEYGRRTFFGMMLTSLKENCVLKFDIAPDAYRDFLSVKKWAKDIVQITRNIKPGIYNLGSGFGITTQEMAETLIKYHGGGKVEYTDQSYKGQFILDMSTTKSAFNLPDYTPADLENDIKAIFSEI